MAKAPRPQLEGVSTSTDTASTHEKASGTKQTTSTKGQASTKPRVAVQGAKSASQPKSNDKKSVTVKTAPATKTTAAQAPQSTPAATAGKTAAEAAKTSNAAARTHATITFESAIDEPAPAPESPETQAAPAQEAPVEQGVRASAAGWFSRIVPGHEHALLGGLVGLILALAVFFAGFWQTLFVSVLIFIGIALGQYQDGDPKIINFIRRLIDEARGNE